MRTLIDTICTLCQTVRLDVWWTGTDLPACETCGSPTARCWLSAPAVHGEIDVTVQHGLCWPDGTPRRFESRQALARAARDAGLTNAVTHLGGEGSDKSPRTQRFV